MIQANELRIGNWVKLFNDELNKIYVISKTAIQVEGGIIGGEVFKLEHINPVPITLEILEKFGFYKTNRIDSGELCPCYAIFSFALMIRHNSFFVDWIGGNTEIKYLHQLQNLYFALTNTELTYKP